MRKSAMEHVMPRKRTKAQLSSKFVARVSAESLRDKKLELALRVAHSAVGKLQAAFALTSNDQVRQLHAAERHRLQLLESGELEKLEADLNRPRTSE